MDSQAKASARQKVLLEHLLGVSSAAASAASPPRSAHPGASPRDQAAFPVTQAPTPREGGLTANPTSVGDSAAYQRRVAASDDIVIVSACRTPLTRAKKGGLKDTPADDMVATVLAETIRRTGVPPEVRGLLGPSPPPQPRRPSQRRLPGTPRTTSHHTLRHPQAVGDVVFGSVMGPSSQRANECRIAMFLAGFPASVPVHTVNRRVPHCAGLAWPGLAYRS